jgi:hypothetical protein
MRRFLLPILLLSACDSSEGPNVSPSGNATANRAAAVEPTRTQIEDAQAAARTLRLYYEHLGRRDYRAAWRMREERPDFAAFERNFAAYEDYRATVGVPTIPVEDRGFVWVEVPVQLYGRFRGGAPFGSVGQVTLKRRAGSGDWRIAA